MTLILLQTGCAISTLIGRSDAAFPIPPQTDWTDYGQVIQNGALGEWDYQLFGAFTGTAVKKDGTYYLYYQGASGYRSTDDTVTWRAIGVATSPDGINFTKYDGNPVVTWFPSNNGEEGAVSGAVTLDDSGEIVLYYAANTAASATLVNADGRLAISEDGLHFADLGIVLDHEDRAVWGAGDELFPIIAVHDAGQWFVYYLPNGTLQGRKLGVAWGPNRAELSKASGVSSWFSSVQAWGMGGSAKVGPDRYVLLLHNKGKLDVRTVSLNAPNRLSAPVETYQFDDVRSATVLLDEAANTWFMYYHGPSKNEYGVKLAPAGEPDTTPPTAPLGVTATPASDRQIDLAWSPAEDSETGIVLYKVFRDGAHQATVKGWSYSDAGLIEQTEYSYAISAVNYHGVEGPQSVAVTGTTLMDNSPPRIVSVNSSGPPDEVTIVFDESVEAASAETLSNYTIDRDVDVTGVLLLPDLRTVILTTSEHERDATYQITVSDVRDRAQLPNRIASNAAIPYMHTPVPGLAGAWTFDEGEGEMAFDTANFGNDGALIYRDAPGPNWIEGRSGGALYFDGLDDQVTIDGSGSLENVIDQSYTFAAWTRTDGLPPNSTPNDARYSVLVRNRTGLYYDKDGRFSAQIHLSDGTDVIVSSEVLPPGSWHHLVLVVDDTNKNLRLYVDGQEVSDSPAVYAGSLFDHEEAPYYVGTSDPLTERYEYRFHGTIDEARIFNHALNPSEIEELSACIPSDTGSYP